MGLTVGVGDMSKDIEIIDEYEETNDILSGDLLSGEELSKFPSLIGESPKRQIIMLATVCGVSQLFIAKSLGVSQPYIAKVVRECDPHRVLRISKDAKKAFITRMLEGRSTEALFSITPEKLEASTANELMNIAAKGMTISQTMNTSKHKSIGSSRLDSIMEAIEVEAGEAPYKEAD